MTAATHETPIDFTTPEGFDQFLEFHESFIRRIFVEHGEVRPMAILLITRDPEGKVLDKPGTLVIVVEGDFGDAPSKNAFARQLRSLATQTQAIASLILFEAWLANGESADGAPPAERLDRREALVMLVEHVALPPQAFEFPIERPKGKPAVVGAGRRSAGVATGRFVDVLGRMRAS